MLIFMAILVIMKIITWFYSRYERTSVRGTPIYIGTSSAGDFRNTNYGRPLE